MPLSLLSLLFRRKGPKKRWWTLWRWPPRIWRRWSESESCVGGEGRGKWVILLVKFSWIRACVKGRLPDHPDQQQVWYFIPKKQLGLQCSNPLKSSPVSHSLLVSDFVGIMSSCLNLAFPLLVSLTSLRLRYLCFSVSISIS